MQGALFKAGPTTVPRTLYSDLPGEASSKPLRGKRLGVHFAWVDAAEAEVGQAFRKALRLIAELGCKVMKSSNMCFADWQSCHGPYVYPASLQKEESASEHLIHHHGLIASSISMRFLLLTL